MKSLIVSILCLGSIVVGWFIFVSFADDSLHDLMKYIDKEIVVSVMDEDWEAADKKMEKLSDDWHKNKKIYAFFLSSDDINQTDYSIARSNYYIKCKDISNSTGELACIKEQLKFLHLNETISLENIL